jgi:hypothetical protein
MDKKPKQRIRGCMVLEWGKGSFANICVKELFLWFTIYLKETIAVKFSQSWI